MTSISSFSADAARQAAAQSAQSSTTKSTGGTLGYEAYLKLLMAQMQNQDPMEPMKSSDYVAQLATFSQVEKTIELKDRVNDLLSAVRMQQAEGLIGKTIALPDGSLSGVVESTMVIGTDVVAVIQDGTQIRMGPGIIISNTNQ